MSPSPTTTPSAAPWRSPTCPGTFVSVELTCYFPEDNCKVHVVVLHITEERFRELMVLRKNLYEMIAYLRRHGIVHFLAHPLYAQNEKLSADHIEKMLLLFDAFEVKNGARAERFNRCVTDILAALTPERMELLANRHNIAPYGDTPWRKAMVGGSDDHSGLFISSAHTAVPGGETLGAFIGGIRAGKSQADGEDGGPLTLAHSIYGIGYSFYRERFKSRIGNSAPFIMRSSTGSSMSARHAPPSWSGSSSSSGRTSPRCMTATRGGASRRSSTGRPKAFKRHRLPRQHQRGEQKPEDLRGNQLPGEPDNLHLYRAADPALL